MREMAQRMADDFDKRIMAELTKPRPIVFVLCGNVGEFESCKHDMALPEGQLVYLHSTHQIRGHRDVLYTEYGNPEFHHNYQDLRCALQQCGAEEI